MNGKVFVPDEPLDLPNDQKVLLDVQPAPTEERRYVTAGELANWEIVGMWADREDIGDSTEWVNEIRRRIDRREL